MSIAGFCAELGNAGLDLTQPCSTAQLAPVAAPLIADARAALGRSDALAIVIGNTRALWPHFVAAVRADATLAASAHPLDHYVEQTIDAAMQHASTRAFVAFGHRQGNHGFPPLQRVADAAGLGWLAPNHLLIHETHGPWIALRALVVFDLDGPPTTSVQTKAPPGCTCASTSDALVASALSASGPEAWRAWLSVRDACPVGKSSRYSEEQLIYHYTHNRSVLC